MPHARESERPVVVDGGSGRGAWFIVGALLVIIVGGIWLYNEGVLSGGDVDVDVTLPAVDSTG